MLNKAWFVLGSLVLIAGILIFLWAGMDFVQLMGSGIPQEDLLTDYLCGIAWAMFLGLSLLVLPGPGRDRRDLTWCWFAKCFVTLGLMLVTEKFGYAHDSMEYFSIPGLEGYVPARFMFGDGSQTMYLISWLHQQIFPRSFHLIKVSCSFIGLLGLYITYRATVRFLGRDDRRVLYILCLWPSLIFWTSILGKDPLVLFGISVYIYGVVGWSATGRLRYSFFIALGIFISMLFRVWLFAILSAPLAVFTMFRMKNILSKFAFLGMVLWGFSASMSIFQTQFNIETKEDLLQTTDTLSHGWATGGSGQVLETRFDSVGKMILFLPLGIFTAIFRPLPGEVLKPFGILAGMENAVLVYLAFQAFLRTRLSDLGKPILAWAFAFVLVWGSVYGFVSYQNLGTAVRFRTQILAVVLLLTLYLRRKRSLDPAPAPGLVPAA